MKLVNYCEFVILFVVVVIVVVVIVTDIKVKAEEISTTKG
jgi:hypothetical protein